MVFLMCNKSTSSIYIGTIGKIVESNKKLTETTFFFFDKKYPKPVKFVKYNQYNSFETIVFFFLIPSIILIHSVDKDSLFAAPKVSPTDAVYGVAGNT